MLGLKVMLVDDNRDFLLELREILSLYGYEAKLVFDSTHALEVARKFKPNVIVLDLRMNKMNGFHLAETLKTSKETCDIPIIGMSGYFPIDDRAALLDMSNMDERIKKPFNVLDLVGKIEFVLNKESILESALQKR